MKANVWSNTELGVGKKMEEIKGDLKSVLEPKWLELGQRKNSKAMEKTFETLVKQDLCRTSDGPMERGRDFGQRGLQ